MTESWGTTQAGALAGLRGLSLRELREASLQTDGGLEAGLEYGGGRARLAVLAADSSSRLEAFEGEREDAGSGRTLILGPLNERNASAIRSELPALRPRPLGLSTSAGFGDRLGLATPGHIRALRAAGGSIAPIFAQQSIREMERTGRSPQQVMDDATWGALSEGWSGRLGADADHLKTYEHVDACLEAGYTFFTFDPGDYVDDTAEAAPASGLSDAIEGLPWGELEDDLSGLRARYLGVRFDLEKDSLSFDEEGLYRAAIKYGRAVAHAAKLYRHLQERSPDGEFEVEVSVDETDSPTSPLQHLYIATELSRLGVRWVSLAPRYVGTFEKGVDYIGDPEAFESDLARHAAIARAYGPYKLSLHSGSDKFSIYEAAARQTRGLVHLKTAGTSYLEALKTVARSEPGLFREIYALSVERFGEDRASYHVSADPGAVPAPGEVEEAEMPGLVEQFDAREMLHVTFGSVLGGSDETASRHRLRERTLEVLAREEEDYASGLREHLLRHLEPFAGHGNA